MYVMFVNSRSSTLASTVWLVLSACRIVHVECAVSVIVFGGVGAPDEGFVAPAQGTFSALTWVQTAQSVPARVAVPVM